MRKLSQTLVLRLLGGPLLLMALAVVGVGCPGCPPPPPDGGTDAGLDGGGDGDGDGDGDIDMDGGMMLVDAGPLCDENTDGFGEACAAMDGDPLCGQFLCCTEGNPLCEEGQLLFCYDLGPNDCGGCGDLDTSEGRIGEKCGEFECGDIVCDDAGTATTCEGDHPRNVCGGCGTIEGEELPGDICSSCNTGVQSCTRDMDDLVCWRGREPDNACGGCERCILYHAYMDQRLGGGYIRTGTLAIIEDIGGGVIQLSFDPLVEGVGTNGLPRAQLVLNTQPDINGFAAAVNPYFAESLTGLLADPFRQYELTVDPANYTWLVLHDYFLNTTISAGLLVEGPPPGYVEPPLPDGGVLVDGGLLVDAGDLDGGLLDDGGFIDDGGLLDDGGFFDDDGGFFDDDGGFFDDDGGLLDAGPMDAGALDAGDGG